MRHLSDIKKNVHPVLVCAPPAADSAFARSKRVFSNGTTDREGYFRLECIGGSRSRAHVGSADEDGDEAEFHKNVGLARRTRNQTRVRIIESEDEDTTVLAKTPKIANSDDAKGTTKANGMSAFSDDMTLEYLKCVSCRHHAFDGWQQRAEKGQEGKG